MAKFLFYDDKIINIMVRNERPSGGAAVQAFGWIRGLSEQGQDVEVLTRLDGSEVLKEECSTLTLLPLYDNKKGVRWLRWVYYRLPFIYGKIRNSRPDYLYQGIPSWQSFVIGAVCRMLGVRYVLRISNDFLIDERFFRAHSRAHRFFQSLGMRMAYCILCQNAYQYNIIKQRFPGKKVNKISNPFFLRQQPIIPAVSERHYIAWLGLYQYQKNLKLLYEIASLLPDTPFRVAGKEESKCDQDTIDYLERLRQLPNVQFVGFLSREEVLPFLAHAKFLLNTSHYEGFSNTFLEAMSVGTPILTTDRVNPDGIISEFNLGIIYKDAADLIQQYEALAAEQLSEMSVRVQHYVQNFHDYKIQAERLLALLQAN